MNDASRSCSGTMYPRGTSAVIIQDGAKKRETSNLSSKLILWTPTYAWRSRTITYSDTDHGYQIYSRTTTTRNTRSPWTTSRTHSRVTAHMMRTLPDISKIAKMVDMIDTRTRSAGHTSPNVVSSGMEYVTTQQGLLVTTCVPYLGSLNPTPSHLKRTQQISTTTDLTTILSLITGERI